MFPTRHVVALLLFAAGAATVATVQAQTPAQTFTYSVLYNFRCPEVCSYSTNPQSLIQASDGNFYGPAYGGLGDYGAIFKLTPPSTVTELYQFCAHGSPCKDGAGPTGGVVQGSDGNFYGTTTSGGAANAPVCTYYAHLGCGTVYKLTPAGTLTTLYTFCSQGASCSDGYNPTSLVEGSDANYYGITTYGGSCATPTENCGVFFRITPSGTFTILHTFCSQINCTDGAIPQSLILGSDGNFYGVTANSNLSASNGGVAFKITPSGTYTVLYTFCSQVARKICMDGDVPTALVQAPNGNFYGTTRYGGATNDGTAFMLTPSGQLTTIYNFCPAGNGLCPDETQPVSLMLASDGNLYGLDLVDQTNTGVGTVFQLTPSGTLTTLYTFCSQGEYCSDGVTPTGLIQGTDGNLYGTTAFGGSASCFTGNCGLIFKIAVSPPEMFLTAGTAANGATYAFGGLVPGSWAQVKGTALSNTTRIWGGSDFQGLGNNLPTNLSGVQVTVNGTPAAVYYISPGQISFQVPNGISGNARVQVINNGTTSNSLTATAPASAPGIFPVIVNGVNYPAGVFLDDYLVGDPTVNSAFRNAKPGDTIQLYATGLVATPAGVLAAAQTVSGVTVTIGTTVIPADFAGLVYAGEFQINFTVPQSFASQPAGLYPISIQVNGVSSPTTINTNPPAQMVIPIQP